MATSENLRLTAEFEALGLSDPEGLAKGWSLLEEAATLPSGDVLVALYWPAPAPSTFASWAIGNVLGIGRRDWRHLRIALLSGGRPQTQITDSMQISVRTLDQLVRDRLNMECAGTAVTEIDLGITALRSPMAPLRTGEFECQTKLALSQVAPHSVAIAGVEPVWRNPEARFRGTWFGHINKKDRDRYGQLIAHYCSPDSSPFFAFITTRASEGDRRIRELLAIPGSLDLAVLDLSDRELSAPHCLEVTEAAIRDLASAQLTDERLAVPLLIVTSQPANFLAVRQAVQATELGLSKTNSENGSVDHFVPTVREKRIAWPPVEGVPPLGARVVARVVGTTVSDISDRLWDLSQQVMESNNALSDALCDASATLRLLARRATAAKNLMEMASSTREASSINWMERRGRILQALTSAGAGGYEDEIRAALNEATKIAEEIFERTPTGMAFSDIATMAEENEWILFALDSSQDAVLAETNLEAELTDPARSGPVPEFAVVGARELIHALHEFHPTRLVLATRAQLIARLLLSENELPRDVDLVVFPSENERLSWILRQTERWKEFSLWHMRATSVANTLPPTLASVTDFSIDVERRATHTPRRRLNRPSNCDGWYETDDGIRRWFAASNVVTVLHEGEPSMKLARDLERGDLVFVMPEDLEAEIAAEFGENERRSGTSSGQQAVQRYKEAVRDAVRNGLTVSLALRRMRELDASLPLPTEQTIRRWLSAGERIDEDRPYAAGGEYELAKKRFAAFARIVGLPKGLAEFLYEDIEDRRTELRLGGRLRRNRFERLLFDPNDVVVHFGLPLARVQGLRRRAMNAFQEIVDVRVESEEYNIRGTRERPKNSSSPLDVLALEEF